MGGKGYQFFNANSTMYRNNCSFATSKKQLYYCANIFYICIFNSCVTVACCSKYKITTLCVTPLSAHLASDRAVEKYENLEEGVVTLGFLKQKVLVIFLIKSGRDPLDHRFRRPLVIFAVQISKIQFKPMNDR